MAERHPTDTALFAHAASPDPAVLAHVAHCDRCRSRAARLSAGARLLAEARRAPSPVAHWGAIDEALAREAMRQATRVRGRERFAASRWATSAIALSAAAAGLIAWRGRPHASSPGHAPLAVVSPVATVPVAAPVRVVAEVQETAAVVLWIASDVTLDHGAARASLTGTSRLAAGSRLRTGARGRVVVAIGDARVDVRPGSVVSLERMDRGSMVIALESGTVRVDGGSLDTRVTAAGWSLSSKHGGAMLAKLPPDGSLRVRVLAGAVDLARADDAKGSLRPGETASLAADGDAVVRGRDASPDTQALPAAWLATDGNAHVLAHPGDGVRFARLASDVDPSDNRVASWLDRSLVAPAQGPARGAAVRASAATARVDDSTAPTQPIAPPDALPTVHPTLASASRWLSLRSASCFAACDATSSCVASSGAWVAIDTNTDGTVSDARVEGLGRGAVAVCVRREARALHVVPSLGAQTHQLALDVPRR